MDASFIVLHSSAGAGKTHALVKHYLARCLRAKDPTAYRQVLALTFTNKAAGEMRERVHHYLTHLAGGTGEGAIASLRSDLIAELGIPAEELQARAGATLHHMLHHWGDVAIGTIDAFTRRVVQPFARELRMDHDLRMTTEQEHYRDAAVELLLSEAGGSPALTELLVATCLGLIEDEQAWRVDKPLRTLSAQLDKEEAITHLQALRELGNAFFIDLDRRLRERNRRFSEQVRAIGRAAQEALREAGITAAEMAHGTGGPHGYFRKLASFERSLPAMGANTAKPLASGKWHSGKASKEAQGALAALAPRLEAWINEAEALRPRMREHAIACAVERDLMPVATLHLLDDALERLKQEEGIAFFSDLTRKVSAIVRDEPAPFIFERLGERYRHFLVDEFQDTSLLQWQCLLPLVENALAGGGTVLLVGDAKQAIYRWRNGEVRQFIDLPQVFHKELLPHGEDLERALRAHHRHIEPLVHNRRSARAVIGFNNRLFGALRTMLPERLAAAYDGLEQEPHKDLEGLVSLTLLEKQEGDAPRAEVALTARWVQEALDDGFAAGDIAVLVRGARMGAAVTEHLVARGHQVISPDGLRLGGDPAAELVIAVVGFLLHRDDAHAARALQHMATLGVPGTEAHPFNPADGMPRKPAEVLRQWLLDHPEVSLQLAPTELIARIIGAIGRSPAADGYLLFLMDEAHAFTLEHGPDLPGLLAHWDRKGSERAVALPPDASAIRVMTIHAAKGLQFPVVILPTTDMHGGGNKAEWLWIAPGEVAPGLPSALVRADATLKEQGVPEVDEEAALTGFDDLNLLYVAFTRPEVRLYAGVAPGGRPTLKGALETLLGEPVDGSWTVGRRDKARTTSSSTPAMLPDTPRAPWQERLVLRTEAPPEWDPGDPDPARALGNAVHDLLACVTHPDELDPALDRMTRSGEVPVALADGLRERLRRVLEAPGMERFFAHGLTVRTEATLIDREGHALRPDRVVLGAEDTRVLDIKTGRPNDAHHDQVAGYVRLLRDLGLPKVSGHLLYIQDGSLIPVEA
jgi:ATP-dependent exoDNAse (exonuclease V) beta subunit